LFNDDRSKLPWLYTEDYPFNPTYLVTNYGFTKDEKLLNMALEKEGALKRNRDRTIREENIIIGKNCKGKTQIRKGILEYIVKLNKDLYEKNKEHIYIYDLYLYNNFLLKYPEKLTFTEEERYKIISYIAYYADQIPFTESLYGLYGFSNNIYTLSEAELNQYKEILNRTNFFNLKGYEKQFIEAGKIFKQKQKVLNAVNNQN
jgi:hypothetical protein